MKKILTLFLISFFLAQAFSQRIDYLSLVEKFYRSGLISDHDYNSNKNMVGDGHVARLYQNILSKTAKEFPDVSSFTPGAYFETLKAVKAGEAAKSDVDRILSQKQQSYTMLEKLRDGEAISGDTYYKIKKALDRNCLLHPVSVVNCATYLMMSDDLCSKETLALLMKVLKPFIISSKNAALTAMNQKGELTMLEIFRSTKCFTELDRKVVGSNDELKNAFIAQLKKFFPEIELQQLDVLQEKIKNVEDEGSVSEIRTLKFKINDIPFFLNVPESREYGHIYMEDLYRTEEFIALIGQLFQDKGIPGRAILIDSKYMLEDNLSDNGFMINEVNICSDIRPKFYNSFVFGFLYVPIDNFEDFYFDHAIRFDTYYGHGFPLEWVAKGFGAFMTSKEKWEFYNTLKELKLFGDITKAEEMDLDKQVTTMVMDDLMHFLSDLGVGYDLSRNCLFNIDNESLVENLLGAMNRISGQEFKPQKISSKRSQDGSILEIEFTVSGKEIKQTVAMTDACNAILRIAGNAHNMSNQTGHNFYRPRGYLYAIDRVFYLTQEQADWLKTSVRFNLEKF